MINKQYNIMRKRKQRENESELSIMIRTFPSDCTCKIYDPAIVGEGIPMGLAALLFQKMSEAQKEWNQKVSKTTKSYKEKTVTQ